MTQQIVNIGSSENKGDGDPLRTAFQKINENFTELYTPVPTTSTIIDIKGSVFADDSITLVDGVNSKINLDGTVKGNIIPDADVAYDLGSATNRFRDLYLSGSTIDLGGSTLSVVSGELQLGGVKVPTTADVAATVASAVSAPIGDLTGSVFADDSTLMIDAINKTMFAETLTTLAVFGNSTLALNADSITVDAQNGNLNLQTTDTIVNNFVNGWEVNGTNGASLVLHDDGVTSSELSVNIDIVDFGTGNTIDMQNCSVLFTGATITDLNLPNVKNTTDTNQSYLEEGDTITVDYLSFKVEQNQYSPTYIDLSFAYNDPINSPVIMLERGDVVEYQSAPPIPLYSSGNHGVGNTTYYTIWNIEDPRYFSLIVNDQTNGRLYRVTGSYFKNPAVTLPTDPTAIIIHIETLKN